MDDTRNSLPALVGALSTVLWTAAVVVVLVTGPLDLSRRPGQVS